MDTTFPNRSAVNSALGDLSNPEIEQAFLGAAFANNSVFKTTRFLQPEDFTCFEHAEIWRGAKRMYDDGRHVNSITVKDHIDLAIAGGNRYLATVAAALVTVSNAFDYAQQIKELSDRRAVVLSCEETISAAVAPGANSDELTGTLSAELAKIAGDGPKSAQSKRQVAEGLVEDLGVELPCYSTGISGLDRAMGGGLFAGKLYGIAARKKVGKTILLGTISHSINQADISHLFIPLEMSPSEIEQRNIARDQGFNAIKFLRRDDPRLAEKTAQYAVTVKNNTFYDGGPGATLDQIRSLIARAITKHKIKGVILDYLQLVGGRSQRDTEEQHTRAVAQTLADIARREKIFILIAAQLNQDGNTRGGEGLRLACDQYYTLNREKSDDHAWLEMGESRYTLYMDVGSKGAPGLLLDKHGPHFRGLAE